MIALLMAYVIVVATVLAASGSMLERAAASRRKPRRWIWIGMLAASLALTVGRTWRPASTSTVESRSERVAAKMFHAIAVAVEPAARSSPMVQSQSRAEALSPDAIKRLDPLLLRLWIVASALLALLYIGAQLVLAQRRRRWRDAELNGVRVLIAHDEGPAVAGIWRSRIVVPAWAQHCDALALDLMLRHEREHQCARDPILIHLAVLAAVAMPWNPAVWWMLSRLKLAVEVDCDARVIGVRDDIAETVDATVYGELLLTVASRQSSVRGFLSVAMLERPSSLARRISAMYPTRIRFATLHTVSTCGAAALFAAVAIVMPGPRLGAQTPAPTIAQIATPQGRQPATRAGAVGPIEPTSLLTRVRADVPRSQVNDQRSARPEDEIYEPGAGITWPSPITRVDPQYTEAAKQAQIQGIVRLRAVVEPDGHVDRIRVVKSLDTVYGLDQSAIDAASKWRFKPSTKDGKPVAVWIELEMDFRLNSRLAATAEFADGAYQPDTPGLVLPRTIAQVDPQYSSQARRHRIQGTVEIEVVVAPDGTVDRARVVKSLDPFYGLDDNALVAARQFTFEPGTLSGKAVPVLCTLTMEFRLH